MGPSVARPSRIRCSPVDAELLLRPAHELAGLLRDGAVSPRELTELSLRRIEERDGAVNAFVEADGERALAEADAVQVGAQPFAGVPIAVKGNVRVAGRPFDYGSAFLAGHRSEHDAFLVGRLRRAGFVIVGTTRLPEFGILPTTEPRHGGPTRNPWNTDRTPGGSSGGSAAAVAAGMVPLAHGNDGGGSIRIPAACCGLLGLKPSRGRISRGPDMGDSPLGIDGVLTRTVADTAALIDLLAGYEVGDATWAPRPAEPYTATHTRDPGRLRIAVSAHNAIGAPVDPESLRGLREAAGLLASLGHEVVEAGPDLPGEETKVLFSVVFGAYIALSTMHAESIRGRAPEPGELEPLSEAMRDAQRGVSSAQYLAALSRLQQLARRAIGFFGDHDLLLTPALAQRPPAIGELTGCGADPWADFERSARFTPFTALFNVTGQPAITVPIGLGEDGLPTCVQLVARPICEDTLLQVAAQIERTRPWDHLVAPV
jgi:amidase